MNLLQSLSRIENKLDKESGSSKYGSHRPPDEKTRARSVSRNHHHSPMDSNKRSHSISSPYPIRKHKRFRVDEIQGEMNKIKPPTFDGENKMMKMQRHGCWA